MPLHFDTIDLTTDPLAVRAVKDEIVDVEFATAPGRIESAVGPNHHAAGDALITGSTGDRWSVARERFDPKYMPLSGAHGSPGRYRNVPTPLLARRMTQAFTIPRRAGGDRLAGAAGDWLVQYSPGDFGIVAAARFAAVYRVLPPEL